MTRGLQAGSALTIVVLACALCGAACGGSGPPARATETQASSSVAPAAATQPVKNAQRPDRASTPDDAATELTPPAGLDLERSPRIPLADGLTVVNAAAEDLGDYEVVMRVSLPASDRVQVSYSATIPVSGSPTELRGGRTMLRHDLDSARIYRVRWLSGRNEVAQGTTAMGLSKAVFEEVRKEGRSECSLASIEQVGSALGAFGLPSPEYEGVLERVEQTPVPVPVVVNGRREWLPAIHAKGTFEGLTGDVEAEFWFLDDPDNPLTLRGIIGSSRLTVVRIDHPQPPAENRLEKALGSEESVELPGIYFEFASATLRPESEAAIADAAAVLQRHPDWRVRLEGHTDAVGGAESNLALSRARADAVRQAIAGRLGGGDRLEATGFGQARPRESNATPEGRARNRRVEIVRVR